MSEEPQIRLKDGTGTVVGKLWRESVTGDTVLETQSGQTYRFRDSDGALVLDGTTGAGNLTATRSWVETTAKAADADLLDGVDSANYARTDVAETFSSSVTLGSALSFADTSGDAVGFKLSENATSGDLILEENSGFTDLIAFSTNGTVNAPIGPLQEAGNRVATRSWANTNFAAAGHTHATDDLSDVDTTTTAPVSGDHLEYNGTSWVNTAPAYYTDADAEAAINADADHGATAQHDYLVPADVTSVNWSDYEIQKDGAGGAGVINFITT